MPLEEKLEGGDRNVPSTENGKCLGLAWEPAPGGSGNRQGEKRRDEAKR